MSGDQDSGAALEQRPLKILALAAQGLFIGVTGLAAAVLTAVVIGTTATRDSAACVDDLVCIPDLGPAILVMLAMPVVIAVVGPLVAKLLRLPSPRLFAMPVAWAVVVASVWLAPAESRNHWPFNSLTSTVLIFLAVYVLLAMWVGGRQKGRE